MKCWVGNAKGGVEYGACWNSCSSGTILVMRVFTPGSPYYAPLPRDTMKSLFKRLFGPFSRGMSSTFLIQRDCGGANALTKYLLLHIDDYSKDCAIAVSSNTHRYVYVEVPRGRNAGPEEFTLRLCGQYAKSVEQANPPSSLLELRELLDHDLRKNEIVFVIRGVNEMADYGPEFWSEMSSLCFFTGRVHVLSMFYTDSLAMPFDAGFGNFTEFLSQNVVPFSGISEKDTLYSIRRWGYMLEHTFSKKEIKEIERISTGCPALIKALCLASAQRRTGIQLENHPLVVKKRERISEELPCYHKFFNECSRILTSGEIRVMRLLLRSEGIVFRSDLAQALWGVGQGNEFSEGALTQTIKRIRVKLENLPENRIRIRTVYGKGYVVDREDMETGGTG